MPSPRASIHEPTWASVAPTAPAAWKTMTAALAKPTSTVTKPATTAETERSRTSDMEKDPAHYSNGPLRAGRGIGYTPRDARVPPVAARADPPGRLPLADRRLLPGPARRRPGPAVPAHGHPGQGPARVPPAPGVQRSAGRAVRPLHGARAARRLRRVAALQERRAAARAGAPARDTVARAGRAAAHLLRGGPGRGLIGGAARLALRPARHDRRGARAGGARLLARPHDDLPVLGAARLAAHRRHGQRASLRDAVRGAGLVLRRAHGPAHPLLGARHPERGVRAHRAGQGPGGAGRHRQAHPQELGDPHRDPGRARHRSAPGRGGHHRDHLRVARPRAAHRAGPAQPRLSGGAGRGLRVLGHLHLDQLRGRPALRLARSADAAAAGMMVFVGRHVRGVLGVLIATLVLLAAVAAPILVQDPVQTDFAAGLKPPGTPGHPLGTDQLGRDLLARVLYGARVALFIGLCCVLLTALVGGVLGLLAGFFEGWMGAVLMRIADVQLSFPFILLALTINAIVGLGLRNIIVSLSVAGWVVYARVVRGEVLSVKQRDFVHAAQALGVGRARVLFRHVLPNVAPSIVIVASLQFAQFIVAEAAISFLGFGVQPPTPAWGSMLSESRDYLYVAWWLAAFPGAALAFTALGINLLGDWLRDVLDPRFRV